MTPKQMAARIAELEARLEISHVTQGGIRRPTTATEREIMWDGITCRDKTIKLLEERINELQAQLRTQ